VTPAACDVHVGKSRLTPEWRIRSTLISGAPAYPQVQSRGLIVGSRSVPPHGAAGDSTMKTAFIRAAAGAAALAASLASAQTYSTYPGYGYAAAPGMVVRCESINSRSNFCRADTRGGVQVQRQLSRQSCIRGRTWRVVTGGIVVDDGCRADFAVASRYASAQDYIGMDRYGRPIYSERASTYNRGYTTDAYGRPVYDARVPYGSGGYTIDRYGNRVYIGGAGTTSGGYYSTDRYGNRVYVPSSGYGSGSGGYYTTDRYGNRVYVPSSGYGNGSGGYYTTDRYGNRVYVPSSGYGRVYDDDYDETDAIYERNVELGPPGYGGGTSTLPTTYGTDVIHCQPSAYGRTYCGDRTRTYSLQFDDNSNCVLNRTYGRDSYGTWVSGGCSMRMETSGY
jgi:hypothetical protein